VNYSNFFSGGDYVCLPSKGHPRVILAVDSRSIAANSFDLYHPFSVKAKVYKFVVAWFSRLSLRFFKRCFSAVYEKKSGFISWLEVVVGTPLISTVYVATDKNKVVLQLQDYDSEILGYLKFPLNIAGYEYVENEARAIDVLSDLGVVEKYLHKSSYEGAPFVLLKPLKGVMKRHSHETVLGVLSRLSKGRAFCLKDHPRFLSLYNKTVFQGFREYSNMLDEICQCSNTRYELVYEHGDFAPWNLIDVEGNCIPFDFECFVFDGLQYMDLIKYYFSIGKLLKKFTGERLFRFVRNKVNIDEFYGIFRIFLIKEIVESLGGSESSVIEIELLNYGPKL